MGDPPGARFVAEPWEDTVNDTLKLVLYIIAALCFAAAAFGFNRRAGNLDLIAGGLLAWVLVPLLTELT